MKKEKKKLGSPLFPHCPPLPPPRPPSSPSPTHIGDAVQDLDDGVSQEAWVCRGVHHVGLSQHGVRFMRRLLRALHDAFFNILRGRPPRQSRRQGASTQ